MAGDGAVFGVAAGEDEFDCEGDRAWCLAAGGLVGRECILGGGTITSAEDDGSWDEGPRSGYTDSCEDGILGNCLLLLLLLLSSDIAIVECTEASDVILLRGCVCVCVVGVRCGCGGIGCSNCLGVEADNMDAEADAARE